MKQTILDMEQYAIDYNVPIIEKKSIAFIMKYIKAKNIKSVLEIGSAIGYSAILMASSTPDVVVTTIERDETRYMECLKNVKKCEMEKKITVVFQDALELNLSDDLKYDLIFIDAAKGQYINFLDDVLRLMSPKGVLVSDNILQEGELIESKYAVTRRNRTIHNRMREYLYALTHNEQIETVILPIADGVTLSVKKQGEYYG